MAEGFKELTKQMFETRKAQQAEFERQQEVLENMKTQLEESGMKAEDNKEYNKQNAALQKKQLQFRLKGADSPSARAEIKEKLAAKDKKQSKLLTVMAKGITGMWGGMKEWGKGKVKGLMAMLKGTLIAGLLIALIAFLDSQLWQDLKKQLVEVIIPKLVHFYKTSLKPFADNVVKFAKDPSWDTLKTIFSGVENKKGLLGTLAGIALVLAPGLVLAPLRLGVGLATKGIAAAWGSKAVNAAMTKAGPMGMSPAKMLGIGALLAGLAMAIKDGYDGWFKSDAWGVHKVAGFFGGFFGGTGDTSTVKGMLANVGKNAAKWGLIGAGVGSFIPIVGTAIGAGVGVLIGTVLGFFGGEKIAKAFNAMGKWIGDMWEKVTEAVKQAFTDIVDWFKEKFAWAKDKVVGFGQKAGAAVATAWTDATTFIRDKVWTPIVTWFTNLWAWAEAGIAEGWTNVTTFITKLWGDVKTWFTELWEWASGGIAEGWTNVTDFIKGKWDVVVEWFEGLWEWASPVTDFSITGTLENVIRTIKEWLFGGEGKTGILQFKIPTIKLPDIGLEMKAKAAGIAAYAKAALPGGKTPQEAYKEAYDAVKAGGEPPPDEEYLPPKSVSQVQEESAAARGAMGFEELRNFTAGALPQQHGGAFSGLKPLLVGEAGPELILPNLGGRVMNAQRTDAMRDAMIQRRMDGLGGMSGGPIIAPTTVANTNSTNITHTTTSIVNPDLVVSTVNKAA